MLGVGRANDDVSDSDLVAFDDLRHVCEAMDLTPESPRHDDVHLVVEHAQRAEVEMIVVPVRDQNSVDLRDGLVGHGNGAHEMSHSSPQQGVGQEAAPVELDEDGRVPDVFDCVRRFGSLHDATVMSPTCSSLFAARC